VAPAVGPGRRADAFTAIRGESGVLLRGFPRGLDFMALLGSGRAAELLHQGGDDAYSAEANHPSYDEARASLAGEFGQLSAEDWNRNLYWSQLYALKTLLAEPRSANRAYQTRLLDTALASWVLSRHAAVLQTKQGARAKESAGPPGQPNRAQALAAQTPEGYVEPLPELYARLLAWVRMARPGLGLLRALDLDHFEVGRSAALRIDRLERFLDKLLMIASAETNGGAPTQAEREFLGRLGNEITELLTPSGEAAGDSMPRSTAFVVDIHTDEHTGQVLEEATGPFGLGVFLFPGSNGRILVGAGPVLSYFEFKRRERDRLTDEAWRALLSGPEAPAPPGWSGEYTVPSLRYSIPVK
jgi:hypothetical protein